ncbi:ornithine--oxo-acid transaminase [Aureispira sp. CCB-E]|uniref:ornithine--oxo-acid transaminase n=1 Tax=Aureispira sp. CCB-E TaxID=3051121 RepID=UPI002868F7F2|nr:ornithine--oxo-acid transaminase [Aureispira sp. CCB-E]WMX16954.1 ornithine--oxo-acid transaminase [Aureispira sp. CCB-E]
METTTNVTLSSQDLMDLEDKHGAHNYHPLGVVLAKGEGVYVWDVEGKQYFDFLSAYSAVNQGHCHPRLVTAITEQASTLNLTSRAFYNDKLGVFEKFATEYFGYDKLLPMNTGAEGVETAIKICRKWGYEKKGIEANKAKIIVCGENFHGRTVTIISFSSDPDARGNFGPYTPGFEAVPYNDLDALKAVMEADAANIAGFLVEPIQGEAGVNVPDDGFLAKAYELCQQHNVLFIGDEIQTGIARTGRLLACDYDNVRPDILILGKALSGGMYPVSAVLADNEIMNVIKPGQHGSTYGGNPMACAVAMEALNIVKDEALADNAFELGKVFRERMNQLAEKTDLIAKVRGKGLLNAILINDTPDSSTAMDICIALSKNGLLAKPTHGNIIRFAPPLVMTAAQLDECCKIIETTILNFKKA